jgi:hypothetical protein
VKVRCDEGVANRIGPESCIGIREDCGEASIGECTGQPLSRGRSHVPGADAVQIAEGNMCGRASASARRPGVWEAAGKPKKECFTALLHHISVDLLRQAFYELKRDARPGLPPSQSYTQLVGVAEI